MLAYCRRAPLLALLLGLAFVARPAAATHAAHAALDDGMAITMTGFTAQQEQTIRDGIALFDNLVSPQLARPASLSLSAVSGSVATTYASWQHTSTVTASVLVGGQSVGVLAQVNSQPQLVAVWVTFGTNRLGVAQCVHELLHVMQLYNPEWARAERAYAAAHPYPAGGMGDWVDLAAPDPESEYAPRVIESLLEGGGMAAYVETQPNDVEWVIRHLESP